MAKISAFREPPSRRGVCADCRWCSGPLDDACSHSVVHQVTGKPTIKAQNARRFELLCGSTATHWEAKP